MKKVVEALEALASRQPKFLNKGGLCVGLVVTETAKHRGLPLDPTSLRTREGGQVAGLGLAAVQAILGAHGIRKVLAQEGGRTSRGSLGLMEDYVGLLNDLHRQKGFDLDAVMAWWIEKVQALFASEGPKFEFDPALSVETNLRALFSQAADIQTHAGGANFVGAMLQHMIGAKLDVVLGAGIVKHHGFSVADHSTKRTGDFEVYGVAIHVTTAPTQSLIEKAAQNLKSGIRPIILTLNDGVTLARLLLKNAGLGDRVEVIDGMQFLTANVYEHSLFQLKGCPTSLLAILQRYNEIVAECETDVVLQIRIGGGP